MSLRRIQSNSLLILGITAAFCQPATAAKVTITITGTVANAFDISGTFGPANSYLNGDAFTLVFTVDDTKGTPGVATCSGNVPYSTSITGSGTSSPATATLTINNRPFTFGVLNAAYAVDSEISRSYASTPTCSADSNMFFSVGDGYFLNGSGLNGYVYPATGTILTADPNWESAFMNSNLYSSPNSSSLYFEISELGTTGDYVSNGELMPQTITVNGPPANVCLSANAQPYIVANIYMFARFAAPSGKLSDYTTSCGFDHLDWQQKITSFPLGSDTQPRNPGPLIASGNVVYSATPAVTIKATAANGLCASWSSNCFLIAPPSFLDPPLGAYTYQQFPELDSYPYYYPPAALVPEALCTIPPILGGFYSPCKATNPAPYVVSLDDGILSFADGPAFKLLPKGQFMVFETELVGVDNQGNPHNLYSWTWQSNFNGTAGGVSQTALANQIDPGSGTGEITVTNINGVQLPDAVSSSQITTTASGLAYSRVSQTFNGTITLTNISSSVINGPLQIVFFGTPATVSLLNATANLSGTPYVTVTAISSLAPGQSVNVSVQFKNPSNAVINLSPVIYAGGIS